jgi:hypothetical protein
MIYFSDVDCAKKVFNVDLVFIKILRDSGRG